MINKSSHTIKSFENILNLFVLYIKNEIVGFPLKNMKKSLIIDFFEFKNNNLQKQGDIFPNTKKLILIHLKSFLSSLRMKIVKSCLTLERYLK